MLRLKLAAEPEVADLDVDALGHLCQEEHTRSLDAAVDIAVAMHIPTAT